MARHVIDEWQIPVAVDRLATDITEKKDQLLGLIERDQGVSSGARPSPMANRLPSTQSGFQTDGLLEFNSRSLSQKALPV